MPESRAFSHPGPQPLEVLRVKLREVELGSPVVGRTGTGSQPWMRTTVLHIPVVIVVRPLRDLPPPQPKEVVIVLSEKAQVSVVIEDRGRIRYRAADEQPIVLQGLPDVRAGQADSPSGAVGEPPGIRFQHLQRPPGRLHLALAVRCRSPPGTKPRSSRSLLIRFPL